MKIILAAVVVVAALLTVPHFSSCSSCSSALKVWEDCEARVSAYGKVAFGHPALQAIKVQVITQSIKDTMPVDIAQAIKETMPLDGAQTIKGTILLDIVQQAIEDNMLLDVAQKAIRGTMSLNNVQAIKDTIILAIAQAIKNTMLIDSAQAIKNTMLLDIVQQAIEDNMSLDTAQAMLNNQKTVIAIREKNNRISLWDAKTCELLDGCIVSPDQHGGAVLLAGFSENGSRLIVHTENGTKKKYEVIDPQILRTIKEKDPSLQISMKCQSPDGTKLVIFSTDGIVSLWNTQTGDPCEIILWDLRGYRIFKNFMPFAFGKVEIKFGCYGTRLIISSGAGVKAFNIIDREAFSRIIETEKLSRKDIVMASQSLDKKKIAVLRTNHTISVWDVATGRCLDASLATNKKNVESLGFNAKGTKVIVNSWEGSKTYTRTYTIVNPNGLEKIKESQPHLKIIRKDQSPDGTKIAVLSQLNNISLWDAESGHCIKSCLAYINEEVVSLTFNDAGNILTAELFEGRPIKILFSDQGEQNESSSLQCSISQGFNLSETQTIASLQEEQSWVDPDRLFAIMKNDRSIKIDKSCPRCQSPDGTKIAIFSRNKISHHKIISLWDAQSSRLIENDLVPGLQDVTSLKFSENGTRLIITSVSKGTLEHNIVDPLALRKILNSRDGAFGLDMALCCQSPDGTKIAILSPNKITRQNEVISLWDAQSSRLIEDNLVPGLGDVTFLKFSESGRSLIITSVSKGTLEHNIVDPLALRKILNSTDGAFGLDMALCCQSPDGTKIAILDGNQKISLWDSQSGNCIDQLLTVVQSNVQSLTFNNEGTILNVGYLRKTEEYFIIDPFILQKIQEKAPGLRIIKKRASSDGTKIVILGGDQTISLWDGISGECLNRSIATGQKCVLSLRFNSNATQVIVPSINNTEKYDLNPSFAENEPAFGTVLHNMDNEALDSPFMTRRKRAGTLMEINPDGTGVTMTSPGFNREWNSNLQAELRKARERDLSKKSGSGRNSNDELSLQPNFGNPFGKSGSDSSPREMSVSDQSDNLLLQSNVDDTSSRNSEDWDSYLAQQLEEPGSEDSSYSISDYKESSLISKVLKNADDKVLNRPITRKRGGTLLEVSSDGETLLVKSPRQSGEWDPSSRAQQRKALEKALSNYLVPGKSDDLLTLDEVLAKKLTEEILNSQEESLFSSLLEKSVDESLDHTNEGAGMLTFVSRLKDGLTLATPSPRQSGEWSSVNDDLLAQLQGQSSTGLLSEKRENNPLDTLGVTRKRSGYIPGKRPLSKDKVLSISNNSSSRDVSLLSESKEVPASTASTNSQMQESGTYNSISSLLTEDHSKLFDHSNRGSKNNRRALKINMEQGKVFVTSPTGEVEEYDPANPHIPRNIQIQQEAGNQGMSNQEKLVH